MTGLGDQIPVWYVSLASFFKDHVKVYIILQKQNIYVRIAT